MFVTIGDILTNVVIQSLTTKQIQGSLSRVVVVLDFDELD